MPVSHLLGGLVFAGFHVAAAVSDLRTRRIPNTLTATCASVGLALLLQNQTHAAFSSVAFAVAITLAAGIAMQWMRLLGGGDVKMLAASAFWLGPAMLDAALYTAVVGGVVALVSLKRRGADGAAISQGGFRLPATDEDDRLHVPYGVAIAAGCVFTWFDGNSILGGLL